MKFKSKLSALLISTAMVLGLGATIGAVAGKDPVKASAAIDTDKYTLVTSANQSSLLSTGDSIVLYNATKNVGVTGYSNKDATVDADSTNWLNFEIEVSGSTFIALDKTTGKYISNVLKSFTIAADSTHAAALFAGSAGEMNYTVTGSKTRILYNQGNFYRSYEGKESDIHYTPFCIYKVVSADVVTSISASPSSVSLYAGETVATPTVTATLNSVSDTAYSNYQSEIGSLSGSTFTRRTDFVFGTTAVTATDNNIRITANNPTVSGGSEYATFDIALTVSVRTLESIYITDASDMTKKAYSKNAAWDYTGLVVMAHYDAGEDVDASTLGTITFTPSVATAVSGTTSITVTASYSTFTSAAKTITGITVSDTVVYDLTTNFATYAKDWSSSYAKHDITEQHIGGTETELPGLTVSFDQANKQGTTITTMPVSKTKGLFLTVTLTDATKSIASVRVNFEQWTTKTPTMSLYSGTTVTGTALDTGVIGTKNYVATNALTSSSFVVSSSSDEQRGIKSIEIVFAATTSETEDAAIWAGFFLTDLACDSTGVTAPSVEEWTTLEDLFTDLSDGAKAVIRTATGNASGTDVQKAVLKYDYIIGKYGTTTYTNYIGRSVVTPAVKNPLSDNVNNDSYMALIVIIGLIGFTSVGAFFYVRKHKEQ